ncbi:effector binding domain-containing protein [Bacillus sp. JCM 19041]|uniref:GyrI-like domain-containing protein n=1 Tax=Bacillus sp. JCM 19041 TaxID=1460637 RepID=UPI00336A3F65
MLEVKQVTLPAFSVVGYKIEATVEQFESGFGKEMYHSLLRRKEEIRNRSSEHTLLMQIYPDAVDFNPKTDSFIHMLCYEVSTINAVPEGMASHYVQENTYANCIHIGLETELDQTYEYLYSEWMIESNNEPAEYDFEVWGSRYKPESAENEIGIFIALK